MPPILTDQPWPPDVGEDLRRPNGQSVIDPTTGRPLRVYHDQIIVWATLAPNSLVSPAAGAPLFPVLLDIGFNDSFLMQQRQAEAWLPGLLTTVGQTTGHLALGRERIRGWDLALWLYPNVPGTRDPDPAAAPVWIDLPLGVTLTPPGSAYSKEKPLLGLRAVRFNRLTLRVDGRRERAWLDAP